MTDINNAGNGHVEHVRVQMTVTEKGTYRGLDGNDYPAAIAWWDASEATGLRVTVFGDGTPSCESFDVEANLPDWIPQPPLWFFDAMEEVLKA